MEKIYLTMVLSPLIGAIIVSRAIINKIYNGKKHQELSI
jgi:hypothetical protein